MKANTCFYGIVLAAVLLANTATATDNDCPFPRPGGGGGGGSPDKHSNDPNEMSGPAGYGNPDTERYVTPSQELKYTIYFENKSTASASAQEIRISNTLSNALDWSTFQLGEVMFSNQMVTGLDGLASGTVEVPQNNSTLHVRIQASVNKSTGVVSWYLRSVDPSTSDGWPQDPYAGILPPNNSNNVGEGYVTYTVQVRSDASPGTLYTGSTANGQIDATATITFDYNDPITTNPAWWNRISDASPDAPTEGNIPNGGYVSADTSMLSWTGSGLAQSYNVYLWHQGDPVPTVSIASGVTGTFLQLVTALIEGQIYAWRVDAVNLNGTTTGQTWTFTAGAPNTAPVLAAIGNQFVNESSLLTFVVSASDADTGDTLIYSASNLPSGASFDPTTHVFTWTPGYTDANTYPDVTFTVTDSGTPALSDSQAITITVNNVNRPPVLTAIGNKTVKEGETLTFALNATDPDEDTLTFGASNLPSGATFDPTTQIFTWTPGYSASGSYPDVLFTVADHAAGPLSDSEAIEITVENTNRSPALTPIGNQTVNENATLTFTVSVSDPDGDSLTYSASNLPSGASFSPDTRTFTWTPGFTAAGSYPNVAFTATDNGTPALSDSEIIAITVTNVNRPPVMTAIGNQSVNEGALLAFVVTSTDPDGDPLTFSASNLPSGATFDPATGSFAWTPGYAASGSYPDVVFTVVDNGTPALNDSETVTITVNNVNRVPVLNPIGNQTVNEGSTLTFTAVAVDPDGDSLTFSTSNLPSGSTFDPVTQVFNWTPGYNASGSYPNVVFSVADDGTPALNDSETITITVNNVNRPPVLSPTGNQSVNEGDTVIFILSATDPDGDPLTYSASNLPSGASFDPTTHVFTWTPGYAAAGTYPGLIFAAVDNGTLPLSGSESITITVNNVNRPPVLNPIGDHAVNEGSTLTFKVAATDPDGDALTFIASNLPAGATFDPVTQTFTWTPDYTVAGSYTNVTFGVSDNGTLPLTDSESITIAVDNVNRPPVLSPIGNQTVNEGSTLTFVVSATDPDGDMLTYTASNLPSGATFDPATRVFAWVPASGTSGNYPNVHFAVLDNGEPSQNDFEAINISVGDVNRPPVLNPIGNQTVNEGALLTFALGATDPDGDSLTFSASNLPSGAVFDPATRVFTWTPGYAAAGSYPGVVFAVTDNGTPALNDSEAVTITVNDVNRAPVLNPIGSQTANEGSALTFTVAATDPDGDSLTFSALNLPSGASFNPTTHEFTWTPAYGSAGTYPDVLFTVTDNGSPALSVSESITVSVGDMNRPPVMNPIGNQAVNEGSMLTFTVAATDPDGDALTYSASNLPSGATFDPVTHVFNWTPGYNASGSYPNATFIVTDNGTPALNNAETITITVNNVNRLPLLYPIGNRTVDEGATLTFSVMATDPDGDALTFAASNLPSGATFDPLIQVFTWTPALGTSDNYPNVLFSVSDNGEPSQTDFESITISVGDVNRPPVLTSIGNQTIDEGVTLTFKLTATDPDNDGLTFSATNLPSGATFDPLNKVFTWTPGYSVSGNYPDVTFSVTDSGTPPLSDSESFAITVVNTNRPPELVPTGNQTVNEGAVLTFVVAAIDPDGDTLTFNASNLPPDATFDPITHVFFWTPAYTMAGSYPSVVFTVTDNGSPALNDSETIMITVDNVNRPPVLNPIGNQTVDEDGTLTFTVNATDPDGDTLTFSADNLPSGASFDPVTRVFLWKPGFGKSGNYLNVLFTVADDGNPSQSDSEAINISVGDVNRPPVVTPIGNQTVNEGSTLTFMVGVTDPDSNACTFAAANLPLGATFDPVTQVFSWTPSYSASGNYPGVSFTVTDNGTPPLADSEAITITVINVNRPPVLTPISDQTIDEGVTLTFRFTATDPDNDVLTFAASNLPLGASFDPATQEFTWTPGYSASGNYPGLSFTVTDTGSPVLNASQAIAISVNNVNRPPTLNPVGNRTVSEGVTLAFAVTATDLDNDSLTFTALNLPQGATLDPSSGAFSWTPGYSAAGTYPNVLFTVADGGTPSKSDNETVTITVTDTIVDEGETEGETEGESQVAVPNVTGNTEGAARASLVAAGLTVGAVTSGYDVSVPEGQVISQQPAANVQVAAGTAVSLVISKGPAPQTVPNLVGTTQDEAVFALTQAGLTLGTVTEANDNTVEAGRIITQDPAAGTGASAGGAVNITVSNGPADSGCGCSCKKSSLWSPETLKLRMGDLFVLLVSTVVLTSMRPSPRK